MQIVLYIDRGTLEIAAKVLDRLCDELEQYGAIVEAIVTRTKMARSFYAFVELRGRDIGTYQRVRDALSSEAWQPAISLRPNPPLDDEASVSPTTGPRARAGIASIHIHRLDNHYDRERFARQERSERAKRRALVPAFAARELAQKKLLKDFIECFSETMIGKYVAWVIGAPTPQDRFLRVMQMVREVEGGTLAIMGKPPSRRVRTLDGQPGHVIRAFVASGMLGQLRRRPIAHRRKYLAFIGEGATASAQRRRAAMVIKELRAVQFDGKPYVDPRHQPYAYRVR